jgi:hypothetical protein
MKIYDCFTFYNEFDLLELRLRELYDHVDHFVIVEANRTFQNKDKPFYYSAAAYRYKPWADKIIRIQVNDMPENTDTWGRERYQRDAILEGLSESASNDIVMIGDVDEIPRPETVQKLRTSISSVWGFRMPLFNFKYNYMMVTQDLYSVWSGAVRRHALTSPEDFRRMRHALNTFPLNHNDGTVEIMEHAGWHFTYLGSEDFARSKIQSFAHDETNRPDILDQLDIEDSINRGVGIIRTNEDYRFSPVAVDDYLPKTITSNVNDYKEQLILNISATSARQHLPLML